MNRLRLFFVSLFTEHIPSKIFAVVFAACTVFLIDREISTIEDFEVDVLVPIFEAGKPIERRANEGAYIILSAEPGVWISNPPNAVKLSIAGPKNLKEDFKKNPVLRVRIRHEQAPQDEDGPTMKKIFLAAKDFESEVKGVVVRLNGDEAFAVHIDRIIDKKDLPVGLAPPTVGLPENRVVDEDLSKISPATVSLIGPRSVLEKFSESKRVTLALPRDLGAPFLKSNTDYRLRLSSDLESQGVSLAPGTTPKVLLMLKPPQLVQLQLGSLLIHWSLSEDSRKAIADGDVQMVLDNPYLVDTAVVLEGSAALVSSLDSPDARRQLAKQIYIIADPNEDIRNLGNKDKFLPITLQAIGVPPGLKARLDPETLSITLIRKDTKK